MVYINLIIAVLIMSGMIAVFPSMVYSSLVDEKYKRKTFWGYFFSTAMVLSTGLFIFVPCMIHAIIDKMVRYVLDVFKVKYAPFSETAIAGDIYILYILLGIGINLIIMSLYYDIKKNKVFKD